MKAWLFRDTATPLELIEREIPTPNEGEVLLRVGACGICHSDVGLFKDRKWLTMMTVPVVPGHEIAGVVEDVGSGVSEFTVGDRVVVWSIAELHGYLRDGGFGEYVVARAESVVRVPEGLSLEKAIFSEPGMTAHAGVIGAGQVTAGQRVGIVGFGALGRMGARIAQLKGADLYIAEPNEAVWDDVRAMGAQRVVRDVLEFTGDDLDLIIDFAGFGTTTDGAIAAVKPHGRVVLIGLGRTEATVNTYNLVGRNVSLLGSGGGTKRDLEDVLALIATGDIDPVISPIDFDGIPAGITRIAEGQTQGRLVALY